MKIKSYANYPDVRFFTNNIVRFYHMVNSVDIHNGSLWYHEEHSNMQTIAKDHGLTLDVVCGMVAALSPNMEWNQNKVTLVNLLTGEGKLAAYPKNVAKARTIWETGTLDALSGKKVTSFAANLFNPYDLDPVTIDMHAVRIAVLRSGKRDHESYMHSDQTAKFYGGLDRYERIAMAYRLAANELGFIPSELQAALWHSVVNLDGYKRINMLVTGVK